MTLEPDHRVVFRVRGRVQGVGFRWFTTRLAERLGVVGWVRNRPDGDVEGEAQARREVLREFLAELETGPQWARVVGVDVEAADAGSDERFEVR